MKHFTLLKTLLVAVGLFTGVSAWADKLDATVKMTYVDYNNPTTSYGEIPAGETAKTGYNNISGGSVGFKTTSWNCNWITYLQVDASAIPSGATITAATLSFEQSGSTDGKRTTAVGAGYNSSTWSSSMTYESADRTIKTIGDVVTTATKKSDVFESKEINITDAFSGDADNIITILLYETEAAGCYIKNPTVAITYTTETAYAVTFEETNGVKATVMIGGSNVTAGTSRPNGTYDFTATATGYKDYAGSFTVAGADKKVTFTMTAKPAATLTVVDNLGNTLVTETTFEGGIVDFYVPYYAFKDGKFYQSPSLSSGSLSYGKSTATITEDTEINVTYTEEENTNVVFFSEAENLTGVTPYEDSYTHDRMSNGKVGYYEAATAFTTLPAGKYTLTASTRSGTTKFYTGILGEGTEIASVGSSGSVTTLTSDPFILSETTDLYTSIGSTSTYFDYVIIRKTGDIPSSNATGFLTYASDLALDFSATTTKAYIATAVSGSTVTLTPVSKVPAGTGLILERADGSTEAIPVLSGDADDVTGNLLVRGTGASVAEGYVLVNRADKAEFASIGETKPTVAKDQAYLSNPDIKAPYLQFVFGSETTAISTVKSIPTTDATVFNIAGQRVAQPRKGLYIVGGKKVVVK